MMKYRRYISIIILSGLLISWHPYKPNLDKIDDNLKGPVKTVIEDVWNWGDKDIVVKEYNRSGKLKEIKFYGLSTFEDSIILGSFADTILNLTDTNKLHLLYKNTYEYSASKKIIKYRRINELKNKTDFWSELNYDINDSLVSIIEYVNNENDSIVIDSTNIYYNIHNTTLEKTVVNNSLDTVLEKEYFFNSQGKVDIIITKDYKYSDCVETERFIYDEYGRISHKIKTGKPEYDFIYCDCERRIFIYNENNQIIKNEYIREAEYDTIRKEVIFEYDSLGNINKEIKFNYESNTLDLFSETIFNRNKDYIDWYAVEYFINKENILIDIPTKEKCEYTYDSFGNWITVKRYRKGKLSSEDKRIIQYYEE